MKRYKSLSGRELIVDSYDTLLQSWGTEYQEKDIATSYGITHVITVDDSQSRPLLLFHGTADNSAMMWI